MNIKHFFLPPKFTQHWFHVVGFWAGLSIGVFFGEGVYDAVIAVMAFVGASQAVYEFTQRMKDE